MGLRHVALVGEIGGCDDSTLDRDFLAIEVDINYIPVLVIICTISLCCADLSLFCFYQLVQGIEKRSERSCHGGYVAQSVEYRVAQVS